MDNPQANSTQATENRIEKLPPFSIVGQAVEILDNNPAPIFELWQSFPPAEKPESYSEVWGVCWDRPEGGFHYAAAFVVPHGTKAPEGQIARTFPGAKYAVFPFKGAPPEMGKLFLHIFKEVLPAAGLKPAKDGLCLEIYPPEPMDSEGNLIADLYVAVE